VISACGSETVVVNEPGPDSAAPDLSATISEQELERARATFELARGTWDSGNHSDYTLEIGIQTVSLVSHTVVGGVVQSSEVVVADEGIDRLPQTVEEIFDQVNSMIRELEDDPDRIAPPGECGWHFNIRFDPELGYPAYYDGLGPCDDGVGTEASVELAG
jgi:hypothetical protein